MDTVKQKNRPCAFCTCAFCNRTITKEVPQNGLSTYAYDILEANGCTAETVTDPKGNSTKKVYDKVGRLIKVIADGQTTTYTYYDNGNRKKVEYSDGSAEEYTYNSNSLLKILINKKSDGSVLEGYTYTYDGAHNQTQKTDKKGTTSYTYDSLNRLASIIEPGGRTTTYAYDRAGSRLSETITTEESTTITTYTYNEENRLTSTTTQNNGTTEKTIYTYDANGNTISKATTTTKPAQTQAAGEYRLEIAGQTEEKNAAFYSYDKWNQQIKAIEGTTTVQSKYNAEGLRIEKTVNGQTTRYLYEYDKVVLETNDQGQETAKNTYGTNLISRNVEEETLYYFYNGHGDVTALIDAAGTIRASYYYDAFGNITEQTGEVNNNIRYAGYQYDDETGLYYLNARMYDPKIARFLTEDTYRGQADDPLSLNLYTYCYNNPIRYYDPTGHVTTEWDRENCTSDQIEKIEKTTEDWNEAAKAGNTTGMAKAHADAEAARQPNRSGDEIGSDSGYTYKVSKDGKATLNSHDSSALSRSRSSGSTTLNGSNYIPETTSTADIIMKNNLASLLPATPTPMQQKSTSDITRMSNEIKLSQTDAASILALENLFSIYKLESNTSGMDATMRTIQGIQQKNGVAMSEYSFLSQDKTTKVSIEQAVTFTLDDIHNLHKKDDIMAFLGGTIPGIGTVLGPLTSYANEREQQGKVSILSTVKNIVLSAIGVKNTTVGLAASGADTANSLTKDKNDTYNRDGVTIRENDTYILIKTQTNQGLSVASIKVYVRDDEIISYEQFGPYGGHGQYGGYENIIKSNWNEAGYK